MFRIKTAEFKRCGVSGHEHAGLSGVETLDRIWERFPWLPAVVGTADDSARSDTPNKYGKYTENRSSLFVRSGLGTVGVPTRLGTNPEIVSIRLTARS